MTLCAPFRGARTAVRGLLAAAVLLALVPAPARPAAAQAVNLGGGDSKTPIEIYADNGIEWQRDNLIVLARGNARAVRGDLQVKADVLRAYYREKPGGGTDIQRLDAEGHVQISTPGETAYGHDAVYNLDDQIVVLHGRKVRLITDQDTITADRQLEYWEAKRMAVARGNALAVRGDRRLRADVLVAYFRETAKGQSKVHRIEAFDNVHVDTAKEKAVADRGVYNVESGIATLTGSVKIARGPNRLKGCTAEVNLNTGISKLFGCPGAKGGRVRGLIKPVKEK